MKKLVDSRPRSLARSLKFISSLSGPRGRHSSSIHNGRNDGRCISTRVTNHRASPLGMGNIAGKFVLERKPSELNVDRSQIISGQLVMAWAINITCQNIAYPTGATVESISGKRNGQFRLFGVWEINAEPPTPTPSSTSRSTTACSNPQPLSRNHANIAQQ